MATPREEINFDALEPRKEQEEEERRELDFDAIEQRKKAEREAQLPSFDISRPPPVPPLPPEEDPSGVDIGSFQAEQYKRGLLRQQGETSDVKVDPEDPDRTLDEMLSKFKKQQEGLLADAQPRRENIDGVEIELDSLFSNAAREISASFTRFGKATYNGLRLGSQGIYQTLDNLTDITSDITGMPEIDLFERWARIAQPDDTPQSLGEKIGTGMGMAVAEIPQWALAMQTGGLASGGLLTRLGLSGQVAKKAGETVGIGALGALSNAHGGAKEAAKGAAEYMLLNGVLQTTAPMTPGFRMGTMATVFGGQSAASGESLEEASAAAITGAVLGLMGQKGDLKFSDVIGGRLIKDANLKQFLNVVKKVEGEFKVDQALAREGALKYIEKYHPDLAGQIKAEGIGKPEIKLDRAGAPREADALLNQMNAQLGTKLGIKPGSALDFRSRMEMLFDRVDTKKKIPTQERKQILDQLEADVRNVNAELNAQLRGLDVQFHPIRTEGEGGTPRIQPRTGLRGPTQAEAPPRAPKERPRKLDARIIRAEREADAAQAEKFLQRSERATEKGNETVKQKLLRAPRTAAEAFLDTTASSTRILNKLIKQGNEAALRAKAEQQLIAGSPARADMLYQEAKRNIFGLKRWYEHPSKEFENEVSGVVLARSLIDVAKRKPSDAYTMVGGEKMFNNLMRWYKELPEKKGQKAFESIDHAATNYFREFPRITKRLLDEGIISRESFKKLKDIEHLPIEYMRAIDPPASQRTQGPEGPRPIRVGDSGIPLLEGGSKAYRNTDIMGLLQQSLLRAEGRIANNRANNALYDFAKTAEGSQLVQLKAPSMEGKKFTYDSQGRLEQWADIKAPEGFRKLSLFRDGKQVPMFVREEFARGWAQVPPGISQNLAKTLRIVSGSAVTRPLATGFNPAFAITNFPRDIVHSIIATAEYSPFLPRALLQMTRDLATVRKDAWGPKHEGRLRDFIEEGGGMNFLTHQGTDILGLREQRGRPFETKSPRWENFKTVMSKVNEVSELWVRLAVRERSLRNQTRDRPGQASMQQRRIATYEARNYLDFSQGGRYTKAADHAIPYLNASTQAARTVLRSARQNPARFAGYMTQLAILDGTMRAVAAMQNPEAYAQISPRDKSRNLIINTDLSFVDPRGNTRWIYGAIPIDPSVAAFLAPVRWAIDRELYGMTPMPHDVSFFEEAWRGLTELNPFLSESIPVVPPTLEGIMGAVANHDFFFDKSIWNGPEVPYEQEVREPGSLGKPTPALTRYLAEAFQAIGAEGTIMGSPERMDSIVRKVVPNHFMVTGADWLANELRYGDEDNYKALQSELQQFVESPGVRRGVSITHPAEVSAEALSDAGKEASALSLRQNNKLDNMIQEMFRGETSRGEIQRWIRGNEDLAFSDRKRLEERFKDKMEIRRMFQGKPSGEMPGGLPEHWWLNLKRLPAIERAEVFHKYWRDQPAEEKQRMWRAAMRLRYSNDRYGEFQRRFLQLREPGGDSD